MRWNTMTHGDIAEHSHLLSDLPKKLTLKTVSWHYSFSHFLHPSISFLPLIFSHDAVVV